jgi:hypothetical protein
MRGEGEKTCAYTHRTSSYSRTGHVYAMWEAPAGLGPLARSEARGHRQVACSGQHHQRPCHSRDLSVGRPHIVSLPLTTIFLVPGSASLTLPPTRLRQPATLRPRRHAALRPSMWRYGRHGWRAKGVPPRSTHPMLQHQSPPSHPPPWRSLKTPPLLASQLPTA